MGVFDDLGIGSLISAGANIYGGIENRKSAESIAAQNIANQRDFAQHGVSWKVADARSAGISPLAALGASTSSFSNVVGSDAMGEGIAAAGQDIGKAVKQMGTQEDRALLRAGAKLDIEGKQLDNDVKRAELASKIAKEGPAQPAMPLGSTSRNDSAIPGQGDVWKGGTKPLAMSDIFGQKSTPMVVGDKLIYPSRRFSDSNVVQNRSGDTIQDLIAPFALDQDMKESLGQRIPEFLWRWANEGADEASRWLYNNRWSVIDQLNKSITGKSGYYSGPRAQRER